MSLRRTVLEVAPSGLSASPVSQSQINLAWTANPRATSYRLYRNGSLIASPTGTSHGDTGLATATTYTYTIASFGDTGLGPVGSAVQATTSGSVQDTQAPTVPGAPVVTVLGPNSVLLNSSGSTDNVGVALYRWQRNGVEIGTSLTPTFTDIGLAANTTYQWRLRAEDAAAPTPNVSSYSLPTSGTTNPESQGSFLGVVTRSAINVESAAVWSTDNAWLNLVKRSDRWQNVSGATVRTDGWLQNLAPGGTALFYTHLDQSPTYGYIPPGNYIAKTSQGVTMQFIGSAVTNGVISTSRATCTVPAVSWPPGHYSFGLQITNNTGSTIPLFNSLVICKATDENAVDTGQIWRPETIASLGNAAVIRTMVPTAPNLGDGDSTDRDNPWVGVATLAHRSFVEKYHVSYDAAAKLAVEAGGKDLWMSLPYCNDNLKYELDAVNNRVYPLRTAGHVTAGRFDHGWPEGTQVCFPVDGAWFTPDTGLIGDTFLYVRNPTAQGFQLSTTLAGAIDVTIAQTTGVNTPYSYLTFSRVPTETQILDHYRTIAQLVKANCGNARVYVELGNEPWNTNFTQFQFLRGMYSRLAGAYSTGSVTGRTGGGNAYMSLLAWRAFLEYFPRNRLIFILNGQVAWFDLLGGTGGMFDYVDPGHVATGRAVKDIVDEYALAPYCNVYNPATGGIYTYPELVAANAAGWSDAQWTNAFVSGNTLTLRPWMTQSVDGAKAKNPTIRATTYETNQHMFYDIGPMTPEGRALTQRSQQYCTTSASTPMWQDHYQRIHQDYGCSLYNQFTNVGGWYDVRFVTPGWGLKSQSDAANNAHSAWFNQLPGRPASIGAEKLTTRVMISGHSLSSHQGAAYFSGLASAMNVSHQYEKQIINGSPIRIRTGDAAPWSGFSQGESKTGVNNVNYLSEWSSPTQVTGGLYTDLFLTERHDVMSCLQWEQTHRYMMLYLESFMARSPGAQPYIWTSWHPGDAGLYDSTAQGWIHYERKMARLWEALAYRLNLTAANKGYSWRVKIAPAAYCVSRLLDEAINGNLPGISQGSVQATIDFLFNDSGGNNVHLNSDQGKYFLALIHMAILTKKSPVGSPAPSGITAQQAASLQSVAWQSLVDHYNWNEWTPRTIAETRSYAAGDAVTTYNARLTDVSTTLWTQTSYASGNPFVFDAATDTAQAGWFTPPTNTGFAADSGFSITGQFADGQIITINRPAGGFGTKTGGGLPLYYYPHEVDDDFNATYSRGTLGVTDGTQHSFTSAEFPTNSAGSVDVAQNDTDGNAGRVYQWNSPSQQVYFFVHRKVTPAPDTWNESPYSANFKQFRARASMNDGVPNTYIVTGAGVSTESPAASSDTMGGGIYHVTSLASDYMSGYSGAVYQGLGTAWHRCEGWFRASTGDGVSNGQIIHWVNGARIYYFPETTIPGVRPDNAGFVTRNSDPTWVGWNQLAMAQCSNQTSGSPIPPNSHIYYGPTLIDDSTCRVLVSDESSLNTSTTVTRVRDFCIPISWTDTQIQVLVRKGVHSTLTGKYLWVHLSDGYTALRIGVGL